MTDAYEDGYAAWQDDVPFRDNPYETEPDASMWEDGWKTAEQENSQFGVGA